MSWLSQNAENLEPHWRRMAIFGQNAEFLEPQLRRAAILGKIAENLEQQWPKKRQKVARLAIFAAPAKSRRNGEIRRKTQKIAISPRGEKSPERRNSPRARRQIGSKFSAFWLFKFWLRGTSRDFDAMCQR